MQDPEREDALSKRCEARTGLGNERSRPTCTERRWGVLHCADRCLTSDVGTKAIGSFTSFKLPAGGVCRRARERDSQSEAPHAPAGILQPWLGASAPSTLLVRAAHSVWAAALGLSGKPVRLRGSSPCHDKYLLTRGSRLLGYRLSTSHRDSPVVRGSQARLHIRGASTALSTMHL